MFIYIILNLYFILCVYKLNCVILLVLLVDFKKNGHPTKDDLEPKNVGQ